MDGIEMYDSFDNVLKVLQEYAKEAERLYKEKLIKDDKVASKKLLNSIHCTIQSGNNNVTVVMHLEDYWKYIENGRGKGKFPPVDKILEWIKIKPVKPQKKNGKLPTEKQLAYLIGRKIAREGWKGGKQLATTIKELNDIYLPRLQDALKEDWYMFQIKTVEMINKIIKI